MSLHNLTPLDEYRLTESDGKVVSFKEAMIIMTSNLGAGCIQGGRKMGFDFDMEDSKSSKTKELRSSVMNELKVIALASFVYKCVNKQDKDCFHEPVPKHKSVFIAIQMESWLIDRCHHGRPH